MQDICLATPKIHKNMFYSKINNKNKDKNCITIENIKLYRKPLIRNNTYTELYTKTSIELKNYIVDLEENLRNLYVDFIDDKDAINYDSILRYDNKKLVSKFVLNNKLTSLVDASTINNGFNINLELHSIVQNNDRIYLLWKLKSLHIIEDNIDSDKDTEDLSHDIECLEIEIENEKKMILKKIFMKMEMLKNKSIDLEKMLKEIQDENNIENINKLYQIFLKDY